MTSREAKNSVGVGLCTLMSAGYFEIHVRHGVSATPNRGTTVTRHPPRPRLTAPVLKKEDFVADKRLSVIYPQSIANSQCKSGLYTVRLYTQHVL